VRPSAAGIRAAGRLQLWCGQEVAGCYGYNGQPNPIDPEVILKLMFLLFCDNVKSERELMRMLPERWNYLWFLGTDSTTRCRTTVSIKGRVPAGAGRSRTGSSSGRWNSGARRGLVAGGKLTSRPAVWLTRTASKDSVVRSSPELIGRVEARLRGRGAQNSMARSVIRLPAGQIRPSAAATDPDAPCIRHKYRRRVSPSLQHHRAVDDRCA